ncbi:hypothetical protein L914_06034 [Phytophthora nicotianae]|uniref:Uncharacterized protein n=1 Tax=Phytophthora nicotianae TaxID=4792 RepID=W2NMI6_PHYNI|nr:hypothetical protein L914_06034 [Phytophthora nicotianae]
MVTLEDLQAENQRLRSELKDRDHTITRLTEDNQRKDTRFGELMASLHAEQTQFVETHHRETTNLITSHHREKMMLINNLEEQLNRLVNLHEELVSQIQNR